MLIKLARLGWTYNWGYAFGFDRYVQVRIPIGPEYRVLGGFGKGRIRFGKGRIKGGAK